MNIINYKPIFFIVGVILSKLALFMYIPLIYAFVTGTHGLFEFGNAIIITHLVSFLLIYLSRGHKLALGVREMYIITTTVWLATTVFASLPFMFIDHISFTDAYFETMSGLTTTGSTVLTGLDTMAPSILLWRSLLQWIGGIGFIVLGVAILPFLNVGGMKLFHTESSDWSDKSAPKAQQVAKKILYVYLVLTSACTICLYIFGMTFFEAVNHAMTILATGGYSTSDGSMNHFNHSIHWVAIVFMILGGMPFLVMIHSLRSSHHLDVFKDAQIRGFLKLMVICSIALAVSLWHDKGLYWLDALRLATFDVVSVVTTTGLTLGDFSQWNRLSSVVFMCLLVVGGCSGSTSGGVKIFRFQIAFALTKRQMKQQLYPSSIMTLRYNGHVVNEDVINSLLAFFTLTAATITIITSICVLSGLDLISSLSATLTTFANAGPGLGPIVGPSTNFQSIPTTAKWALDACMVLGRLELMTIFIIFTPAFWRN